MLPSEVHVYVISFVVSLLLDQLDSYFHKCRILNENKNIHTAGDLHAGMFYFM